jgi:hypothetical protein
MNGTPKLTHHRLSPVYGALSSVARRFNVRVTHRHVLIRKQQSVRVALLLADILGGAIRNDDRDEGDGNHNQGRDIGHRPITRADKL